MNGLKTKLRQFIYVLKHDYLNSSNVIFFIAIVFCVFWTYSSIIAMSRNWKLAGQIAEKKKELAILELEVETLKLENEYYSSPEYQELSARAKQNKKLEGENLVILPDNSEYAKNKHKVKSSSSERTESSNFSKWMSFLFGV